MIGFRYGWDDPEYTVIHATMGQYWDWDDFHEAIDGIASMIQSVDHQVDIIVVMRPTTPIPEGNALRHLKTGFLNLPSNTGIHVLVGANILTYRVLRKLTRRYTSMQGRLLVTSMLGDAYRIVARNRPEVLELDNCVA